MQALTRSLSILRAIANQPERLGVTDLAERLALPKSTMSRFCSALEAEGMILRTAENRFTIGPGLHELSRPRSDRARLVRLARPVLETLNRETGEAVGLSVLEEGQVLYIDHIDSVHAIQVVDWVGRSAPPHAMATGNLLLAHAPDDVVDRYLSEPLEPMTLHTLTDPAALRARFKEIRAGRLSTVDEGFALEVIGFAAPVWPASAERPLAAITVYGPKFRLADHWVTRLVEAGRAISLRLDDEI